MFISRSKSIALVLAASSLVSVIAGCNEGGSPADDHVRAKGAVINKTSQAASSLSLNAVKGKYGPLCQDHPTGSWILDLVDNNNSTLEVLKGDTDCELFIEAIDAQENMTPGEYAAPSPQKLTDMYLTAAPYGQPVKFYATAKLSANTFSADFTIDIMFSDILDHLSDGKAAKHTVVKASAGGLSAHDSPDYGVDLTSVDVQTNMYHRVFTRTGDVVFTPGSQPADSYVLIPTDITSDFATADAIWQGSAGSRVDLTQAPPNDPVVVPAASLLSVDDPLTQPENEATDLTDGPAIRSFVFHSVSPQGVHAYQIVKVAFIKYDAN